MAKVAMEQAKLIPPIHTRPQVANLIHRDAFSSLDLQTKLFLTNMLGTKVFVDFCRVNLEATKTEMVELSPRGDWTAEDFVQISNDMRLVWRFWTDLMQYAEEFLEQNRTNEG